MSDARKRKLQSSLAKSSELPESLRFVPSSEPPTNGPHAKKQKVTVSAAVSIGHYESGLLNLQAEELLKSARPKSTIDANLAKLVSSVRSQIEAIPDSTPAKLHDVRRQAKSRGIAIPFEHQPSDDLQLNFTFSNVTEISSYSLSSLNLLSRPTRAEAVLAVELPAADIQEKDYLNHRIQYKMDFYLSHLASGLKNKYGLTYERRKIFGVERTVLVVRYKERQVMIHLTLPPNAFDESKLSPSKNADRSVSGASSTYNSSLLKLSHHANFMDTIKNAAETSPGYRDAVLLAHQYLTKRQLPIEVHQWALATALLLTGGGKNGGKVLSPNASGLQLFRGTLLFLSQFCATERGSHSFAGSHEEPGCWIGDVNILSSMTEQQRLLMKREFGTTIPLINNEDRNPVRAFEKVFLETQNALGRWDLEICIDDVDRENLDPEKLWRVLTKALHSRASVIYVTFAEQESSFPIDQGPLDLGNSRLNIQISLQHEEALANMILGPPANAADAPSFRGFWGEYAELRKFKDGRILETVVLSKVNPSIDACKKILALHFPKLPKSDSWTIHGESNADDLRCIQRQKVLVSEFDEFARIARDLEDLPLRITSISSSDSLFSHCCSIIPTSIEGVIQFESSARWPDDLEAIQRTKAAFLLALCDPFSTISGVSSVRVGLENQHAGPYESARLMNSVFVQVQMASGISYHLRIHHDREKSLSTTFLKSAQSKQDISLRKQNQAALQFYNDTYITRESHSQHMRNMISLHPALPESVILLRKWFTAHLLDSHFSTQIIELLALNVFVNDSGSDIQSPQSAFLRTMQFLASWDWRQDAIILVADPEVYKMHTIAFDQIKIQDPGHSLVIYTPYTAPHMSVTKVAALRMTSLVKASNAKLQAGEAIDRVMATPFSHFDFVITLIDDRAKKTQYKNLQTQSVWASVAELFKSELDEVYGEVLYFFTSRDSCKVGVLVDPALYRPRRYKPNLGYQTKPVHSEDESQKAIINLDATIAEIERIGHGIIKKIERK